MKTVLKVPCVCPHCQCECQVRKDYLGQQCDCPECGQAFEAVEALPKYARSAATKVAPADSSEKIDFKCRACGAWHNCNAAAIGKEIKCPVCKEMTVIRPPKPKPDTQLVEVHFTFNQVFTFAFYFFISNLILSLPFLLIAFALLKNGER